MAPCIELAILEVIDKIEAVLRCATLWATFMFLASLLVALISLLSEDNSARLIREVAFLVLVGVCLIVGAGHIALSYDARRPWPDLEELAVLL